jgi:ABC-type Zn2+ transport system substrate-binding protein/surface adhesin
LKTLKESGDEAEVEIVNFTMTVSTKGTTVTMNLKDYLQGLQATGRQVVEKLKKLDGKWLITGEEMR